MIEALDEDKSETSSPIEGNYEIEITSASEHTSKISMKEQLEKEKEKTVKIKVEPRVVDLDESRASSCGPGRSFEQTVEGHPSWRV